MNLDHLMQGIKEVQHKVVPLAKSDTLDLSIKINKDSTII